jgi:hypothetical protein
MLESYWTLCPQSALLEPEPYYVARLPAVSLHWFKLKEEDFQLMLAVQGDKQFKEKMHNLGRVDLRGLLPDPSHIQEKGSRVLVRNIMNPILTQEYDVLYGHFLQTLATKVLTEGCSSFLYYSNLLNICSESIHSLVQTAFEAKGKLGVYNDQIDPISCSIEEFISVCSSDYSFLIFLGYYLCFLYNLHKILKSLKNSKSKEYEDSIKALEAIDRLCKDLSASAEPSGQFISRFDSTIAECQGLVQSDELDGLSNMEGMHVEEDMSEAGDNGLFQGNVNIFKYRWR